ncbi:MAG: helix-turn-helix domain-containing protein [Pyrinomonadaceae bacterium]
MANDKAFQERLGRIFDHRSMADIARRIGLPHATVRNYFGGRLPAPEVLIKIADVTNVSLNWLLTGKGEMYAGDPKGLDIGIVIDARIAEIVERKLAERFEPDVQQLGTIDEPQPFDVATAIGKFGDPQRVMAEWFKFEGRKYPKDFGVVFFQGWESFSEDERVDAIHDAKKVLDRTLRNKR